MPSKRKSVRNYVTIFSKQNLFGIAKKFKMVLCHEK